MPRIGFARQGPSLKSTVVRGGYAMSMDTEIGNLLNSPLAPPFWVRTGISEQAHPGIGLNTRRATLANLSANPVDPQPLLPGFKAGDVQPWTLSLEKALGNATFLSGA